MRIIIYFYLLINFPLSAQKYWSIEECFEYAAEKNLTVQQNLLFEKLAERDQFIAESSWLPVINGTVTNSFAVGAYNSDIYKGYQQVINSTGVQSQIVIYNGNVVKHKKEKALRVLEASKINIATTINDISLQIVNLYLNALYNKELKVVAEQNLAYSRRILDSLNFRNEKNLKVPRAAIVQAESEIANNLNMINDDQIAIDRSLFNIAVLLQLPSFNNFDIKKVILPDDLSDTMPNLDEVLDSAFRLQPSLKLAEKNIEIAKVNTEISKTSLKPTISGLYYLGGGYMNYFNDGLRELNFVKQLGNNLRSVVGLNLTVPIWNQYTLKTNVEKNKINEEISQNLYLQQRQTIIQNVRTAFFDVTSSYSSYQSARDAVKYARISFEYAQESYGNGSINLYDFNRSRHDLLMAINSMLESKYNYVYKLKVLDFYAGKEIKLQY